MKIRFSVVLGAWLLMPALSAMASQPQLKDAMASPMTLTYRAELKVDADEKLRNAKRSLEELVKVGTIDRKRADEEYAKQVATLSKSPPITVVISTDGKRTLYRELVNKKVQTVVLFGDETSTYEVGAKRLTITAKGDGFACRYWPYVPENFPSMNVYGEAKIPAGHSIDELHPLGPSDEVVGIYPFATRNDEPLPLAPGVLTRASNGQPKELLISAGQVVSYDTFRSVGGLDFPVRLRHVKYPVTANPGAKPAYTLGPKPSAEMDLELVQAEGKPLDKEAFTIETYLSPNDTVEAGEVLLKYRPEDGTLAEQIEKSKFRSEAPRPAPSPMDSSLFLPISIAVFVILVSLAVQRVRARR